MFFDFSSAITMLDSPEDTGGYLHTHLDDWLFEEQNTVCEGCLSLPHGDCVLTVELEMQHWCCVQEGTEQTALLEEG